MEIESIEECAVRITVRERPLLPHEIIGKSENIFVNKRSLSDKIIIIEDRPFAFDKVISPDVTQEELYISLIKPLVYKTLNGFHCTVLAYGQTGTGKSFTMGLQSEDFDKDNAGMVSRALTDIFHDQCFKSGEKAINIYISFIEIYNEKVYDLLSDSCTEPVNTKGYKFIGGTKRQVNHLHDAQQILREGNKNRHVRPTKMNTNSSRSHGIFTIHTSIMCANSHTESALNLVDLAGSEGVRRTGHQGVALTEGVNINQGLLSIAKVLQALSSKAKVIPYRDSVLSSVLQDSLNVNSYFTLLACISPLKDDISETLSTLRFAQSAKTLKHTPQVNAILAEYKRTRSPTKTFLAPPLRQRNPAVTPTPKKHVFLASTAYASKRKPFQSNTFCTPNKLRRMEYEKHNQSDFGITPVNPYRNNPPTYNIPITPFDRDSIISNTTKSFLDISTSTAIDAPAFSPIIKRCMKEFEETFSVKIQKMLESIQTVNNRENQTINKSGTNRKSNTFFHSLNEIDCTVIPKTSFQKNKLNNISWNSFKREIKDIVRSEISNIYAHKNENINQNTLFDLEDKNETPILNFTDNFDCIQNVRVTNPLVNETENIQNSSEAITILEKSIYLLNMAEIMATSNEDDCKNSPSINRSVSNSNVINVIRPQKSATRKSTRRMSSRLLLKQRHTLSSMTLEKDNDAVKTLPKIDFNKSLRRSIRMCVIQKSVTPKKLYTNETEEKEIYQFKKPRAYKSKLHQIKGSLSKIEKAATKNAAKSKQKDFVLKLLNTGNIKELQILPQVGLKTAYQIITNRSIHGKFNNFEVVSKLPIWRGKAWKRFEEANNLI